MTHLIPMDNHLDYARQSLVEQYPWSPNDYIRDEAFIRADRALYADELTRTLAPENDLRFIYRDDSEKADIGFFAERLPWDSNFFGYPVAQLNLVTSLTPPAYRPAADYVEALRTFVQAMAARGIKYLFIPVDARDLAVIRALCAVGFVLIETRCLHHRSLKDFSYSERFPARMAVPADIESTGRTLQRIVNPYDRFHADPFLSQETVDRLMYQWAVASILEGFADFVIVPDTDHPGAIMTARYHKEKWERWGVNLAQPIVAAVAPEYKGWMFKLFCEVFYQFAKEGAEHVLLTTQINNQRAIKVYEKLGCIFGKGSYIFRILL